LVVCGKGRFGVLSAGLGCLYSGGELVNTFLSRRKLLTTRLCRREVRGELVNLGISCRKICHELTRMCFCCREVGNELVNLAEQVLIFFLPSGLVRCHGGFPCCPPAV
jgi:hypothetical protein